MPVKIRQLRAFDTVVRLGSFVEAAQALHVTPAALSLAIKELEDNLGFRVLERTTRRLRLSEPGRGYLALAQRILADLDGADRYASQVRAGQEVVRVATTQTVIATLLIHALPGIHQAFPQIRLHPLDVASAGIPDALGDGQADIAIGVILPNDEGIEVQPFFASRWCAFLNPSHALARRRFLEWRELAAEPLFMTRSSNYLRLRAVLGKEVELENVQDATTATAGITMAATGEGIAVFPTYAKPLGRMLGARSVPVLAPDIRHQLVIGVRRTSPSPAPIHAIRDLLISITREKCQHLV